MNENKQEIENAENISAVTMWWSMIIFAILAVVGICLYPYILKFLVNCKDVNILGPYGDMYGPLNPLVSAFAFIALVYSLSMQQRQLKLQRKDLQNQREDLALQRNEMEKQREVSEAQTRQFEAQVKLAEKSQKIDEVYKRLSIVVQLATEVVYASLTTATTQNTRRIEAEYSEKSTRAICLIHARLMEILQAVGEGRTTLLNKRTFILDRFLNVERWLCSILNVVQYVRYNFDTEESVEFANVIMSTCSNSQKFLVYTFAGADNHERGEQIRSFLLEKQIIPNEIIPDVLFNGEYRCELDEIIHSMNTYKKGN